MRTENTTTETTTFGSKIKGILTSLFGQKASQEETKQLELEAPRNPELETIYVPSELYADFVRRAVESDRNHPDSHYTRRA